MTPPRRSGRLPAASPAALLLLVATGGCAGAGPAPAPAPAPAPLELEALPPYAVYTAEGEPTTLDAVVAAMAGVDVVFVGEEHDDSVGHEVELELLERAFRRYGRAGGPSPHGRPPSTPPGDPRTLVLSLEMFERDVQLVLDEYLAGLISEDHLLASARPWARYATDYKPMVEFAKAHGLPVIAANAPRRYVNMVSRGGRDALAGLSEEARAWLPPLPYPQPSDVYRAQWDSVMAEAMGGSGGEGQHAMAPPESVLQAQALWDAGMAWAVAGALERFGEGEPLVLHYAGGFHVERGTGTPEALGRYAPGARFLVVAMRAVEDPRVFGTSHVGRGDFVVLTREGG